MRQEARELEKQEEGGEMLALGGAGQVTAAGASSTALSGWPWGTGHEGDPLPPTVSLIRTAYLMHFKKCSPQK